MPAINTNKQILIVDRDVAAVEPLRQRLTDAGFAVRALNDGVAAVTAMNDRPPHMVIIDVKPFSLREVVARVSAILRTNRRGEHQRAALCCDELVLDSSTTRVTAHGRSLSLRGAKNGGRLRRLCGLRHIAPVPRDVPRVMHCL